MPLSKLWDNETFSELALPALTTLFGLQMLRLLLPSFVWFLGDSVGIPYVTLGLIALGTFVAAFLVGAVRRVLGTPRAFLLATGGVGLMRLIAQISTIPALDLVIAMLGTLLYTFFFPLYLMRTRREGKEGTGKFGRGFLLGIALDTTILGGLGTLDLAWQEGWLPVLFVAALVGLQWWLLARNPTMPDELREPGLLDNLPLIAVGPFIFVMELVFQNVARATALTGFAPPMAFGLIVLANAIGLAAALLEIVAVGSTIFGLVIGTVFLAFLTSRPLPSAAAADMLYFFGPLLLFPFITLVFYGLGGSGPHKGFWRTSVANGLGWVLFALFAFVYYISYSIYIPIANTLLPPVAVVLVCAAMLMAMRKMPSLPAAEDWTSATIAAVLFLVPVAMGIGWRALSPTAGKGLPVRVMTYNLHNGFDTAGQLDVEAIAETIEQAKPDIIALEEVDRGWYIDSSIDLLDWLSRRLQMPYIFGPTADRVWGNAILSRFPIKDWRNEQLPPRSLLIRRGFLWARVDVGGGDELLVIATHFHDIDPDSEIRQQQSPVLVNFWNRRPRTVLLGDFNARPEAKEIQMLRSAGLQDALGAAGSADGFSWPSDKPDRRIDYIWYSPDLVASDLFMPRSTASDHLGLAVTVGKK